MANAPGTIVEHRLDAEGAVIDSVIAQKSTELAVEGGEAPVGTPGSGVVLLRAEGPRGRVIFADPPIVGPKRWAPLQQQRSH